MNTADFHDEMLDAGLTELKQLLDRIGAGEPMTVVDLLDAHVRLRVDREKLRQVINQRRPKWTLFEENWTRLTELVLVAGRSELAKRIEAYETRSGTTILDKANPPKIAEFLLTALATTRVAEAMIGDLSEHFARDCKEFGRPRAVRLYWARTHAIVVAVAKASNRQGAQMGRRELQRRSGESQPPITNIDILGSQGIVELVGCATAHEKDWW
jgi:hypothetical protein